MKHSNRMIRFILILTLVTSLIVVANVFFVSVVKVHLRSGTDLSLYADAANTQTEVTKATRGNIYDRNGTVIAQDVKTYNITCVLSKDRPSADGTVAYVEDPAHTATVLSEILGAPYDDLYALLIKDVYQTELGTYGRNISREQRDAILATDLTGIEFTDSIKRTYPLGTFASNLIGFAQSDESGTTIGKMGIELIFEDVLAGTDGTKTYQADKNGFILPGMKVEETAAVNGNSLYLTLDQQLQETLESAFESTANISKATRLWGAVMEISTGRILAWGQYPSFDPNVLDITDYNNYGAQIPYEPGSTMKSFLWATAMNEGVYDGEAEVYSGPFCYSATNRIPYRVENGGYGCITNASYKNYGWIPFDKGLVYSSNVVAASIETEVITPDVYFDYLDRFGFFQPVSTDGLAEENGIRNITWPGEKLALAYGQGSTVTMLQMLQAYSAIFGNGQMVKPYFVESIRDSYDANNILYQASTQITGTPITAETAAQMQALLYRVVNDSDGTAKGYQIPECKIIGKTGTTQVSVNGSYSSGISISSLMAALPAEDPQYIVYYCYESPYDYTNPDRYEPVQSVLRKVAMLYNLGNTTEPTETETPEEPEVSTGPIPIETYTMPDLVNHTLQYVDTKIGTMNLVVDVLGEGNDVIRQYPIAGSEVSTLERIFLLTDTNGFAMPDMTGWTRKDVVALWEISGFAFRIEGTGKVTSQSIPPGSYVSQADLVEVVLE